MEKKKLSWKGRETDDMAIGRNRDWEKTDLRRRADHCVRDV